MLLTAGQLGRQLHVGAQNLSAALWRPIRMEIAGGMAHRGQPHGGLFTSTLLPGGESDLTRRAPWLAGQGRAWWELHPDPRAVVLTIDTEGDLAAVCRHFPHPSGYPNFAAIAADGFAAVHVTERGTGIPNIGAWDSEATLWLRWSFVGDPVRLSPPEAIAAAPPTPPVDAPPPAPGATRQAVHGWGLPSGLWLDARPFRSDEMLALLNRYARERGKIAAGATLAPDLQEALDGLATLIPDSGDGRGLREELFLDTCAGFLYVNNCIVAHNFTDASGEGYPTGQDLALRLLMENPSLFRAAFEALAREGVAMKETVSHPNKALLRDMAARAQRPPGTRSGIAAARPEMIVPADQLGVQLHVGASSLSE
jgi:hypothetical protein